METRNCTACKGTGKSTYPGKPECYACKGTGTFDAPDFASIQQAIKGRKGLRSAAPRGNNRAYYVWRLARFHGGIDVRMPIMAEVYNHGDQFLKELDTLADEVAKQYFGTNMASAYRWMGAMRGTNAPSGLPATSYAGGPVVLDGGKNY